MTTNPSFPGQRRVQGSTPENQPWLLNRDHFQNPDQDINSGISGEILRLLPDLLTNPDVVFRNREFGELRPHAFISSVTWLGQTQPSALGVLLESWLVKGEFQVTAKEVTAHRAFEHEKRESFLAEFGERAATGKSQEGTVKVPPFKRLFIYRVNGSGLSGSHVARGIDPDTGQFYTIGHPKYETRLPGALHEWFQRFKEIGGQSFTPGVTGKYQPTEQEILAELKKAVLKE